MSAPAAAVPGVAFALCPEHGGDLDGGARGGQRVGGARHDVAEGGIRAAGGRIPVVLEVGTSRSVLDQGQVVGGKRVGSRSPKGHLGTEIRSTARRQVRPCVGGNQPSTLTMVEEHVCLRYL